MKEIKLKSVTTITVDGKKETVGNIGEMFDVLNIPDTPEYHEARVSIVQRLIAFHEIDLSPAYPGHSVHVSVEFVDPDDQIAETEE